LQTIGGKGQPNFVFYAELRTSRHINRATQKTKQMNNTDPTKKSLTLIIYFITGSLKCAGLSAVLKKITYSFVLKLYFGYLVRPFGLLAPKDFL
jgi:hypothetical protein